MIRGKIKLEERFMLLIFAVGLICFVILGYVSYNQISKIIISQNQNDAMGLVRTAANEIDGDVFEAIAEVDDESYQEVYHILENYKLNNLISYIYALKKDGNDNVYVVDTDEIEPASFLEKASQFEEMEKAFRGEVTCDLSPTTNRWGTYFRSYAPIFNADGMIVGVVGCDISMDNINSTLEQLKNLILIIISVFAIIIIITSIGMSREFMNRDPLTEIANYEKLMKVGARLHKKNKLVRYSGILFSIKDQKFLNQKVGVNTAESVIREYAKNLNKRMKRGDYLFAVGDSRFFALVKKEREQLFLDALLHKEVTVAGKDGTITLKVSVQSGIFQIREKDNIVEVFNYCSLALDDAKKQGEMDFQWFEEEMIDQMVNEREIINAFKTGIARREFVVYYQPKVNINTNTLCGAEALVRWFKNGKMVPPDSFIPILEKNNLVTELDFYVFDQVCRDIDRWENEGIQPVKISSNFSKLHLKNAYFVEDILDVVDKYQIDTKYIEAELTESSGYYDFKALELFVYKMNKANISISIDDFGTGYSSLSVLKDLNFDVVKMDKSFFKDIHNGDAINGKMVENVIRMVKDLERDIISEGIENEKQAGFLKKLNAPIVQGYLFDKPLPHNEFEKRLKNPVYDREIV